MLQRFNTYLQALLRPQVAGTVCCLLLSLTCSAQATQLWVLEGESLERSARLWVFKPNAEPQLRFNWPAELYERFSLASPNEFLHKERREDNTIRWFALDPQSGKQRLILNTASLVRSFVNVYPERRANGSYFANAILPTHQIIYKLLAGKAPQILLNRPDLYDFRSLPQGGYVFVTWPVQGRESPDFIDFIPGKKMQLWHQPASGKLKRLGAFDTVLDLRVVDQGQQLLFFTPGQTQPGQTSWKLIRLPLSGATPQRVAEIPKLTKSRGTPLLASWEALRWVAYASPMLESQFSNSRHTFVRQELGQLPQVWFEDREDVFLKGWSPQGYLMRMRQTENSETLLQCWHVSSGQQRAEYSLSTWTEPYWMQGVCVD